MRKAWLKPGGKRSRMGLSKSLPNTMSAPGMSSLGMKLKDIEYWSDLCSSWSKYEDVCGDEDGNPVKCFSRTAMEIMMCSDSKVSVSVLLTGTSLWVVESYEGPAVTRSRYFVWSEAESVIVRSDD